MKADIKFVQHLKTVTVAQLRLPQSCLLRWIALKTSARRAYKAPAGMASIP